MSRKSLTVLMFLLFAVLALTLLTSDRGLAGVLEKIGDFISKLFV